jgi:hypothetical protein
MANFSWPSFTLLLLSICGAGGQSLFTWQGRLSQSGGPAQGLYDLEFRLMDSVQGGNQVGTTINPLNVPVSNGIFTVDLDFGAAAFDGSARWLQISVRTNGASASTTLSPRTAVGAAPYATYAGYAARAATAQAVTGPSLGTNTMVAGTFGVYGTNIYAHVTVSNGTVSVPAWNSGSYPIGMPGLEFFNTNGTWEGGIESWANHGGSADTPELLVSSRRNIALQTGTDDRGSGGLQMGTSGENGIQYNQYGGVSMGDVTSTDGLTRWPIGHSSRFGWHVQGATSPTSYGEGMPGMIGVAAGTNQYFPSLEYSLLGELWFYSLIPQMNGRSFNSPGVRVGRMLTNGWDFRGRLLYQREALTEAAGACSLDFGRGACLDYSLNATNVIFFTTNAAGTASNYEARVFIIRCGEIDQAGLHWPAGWSWLGNDPVLTTLSSGQLIRLRLESVGDGETNILARAEVGLDHTTSWDADAQDFIARAVITDPLQKISVNRLAQNAKRHGWWNLCDAIYPFVGGTAASHSQNLRSQNFAIGWSANGLSHGTNGVTGDGISGYGDTGFRTGTSGQFAASSGHLFVYCATQAPTSASSAWIIMGNYDDAARASLGNNGGHGVVVVSGLNSPSLTAIVLNTGEDDRGPIITSRTATNFQFLGIRALLTEDAATTATATPSGSIILLGRGYGGGGVDHLFGGTISGATIGSGISESIWQQMKADWDLFEGALGRAAP